MEAAFKTLQYEVNLPLSYQMLHMVAMFCNVIKDRRLVMHNDTFGGTDGTDGTQARSRCKL